MTSSRSAIVAHQPLQPRSRCIFLIRVEAGFREIVVGDCKFHGTDQAVKVLLRLDDFVGQIGELSRHTPRGDVRRSIAPFRRVFRDEPLHQPTKLGNREQH